MLHFEDLYSLFQNSPYFPENLKIPNTDEIQPNVLLKDSLINNECVCCMCGFTEEFRMIKTKNKVIIPISSKKTSMYFY